MRKTNLFCELMIVLIVSVTGLDIYWSVMIGDSLYAHELNPVARWVISQGEIIGDNLYRPAPGSQGVALLCALKSISTFVVVRICQLLVEERRIMGVLVLSGVAGFQIWLACFLVFS